MHPRDDPFRSTNYVYRVIELLKVIRAKLIPKSGAGRHMMDDKGRPSQNNLPLESGRALAVTFLESTTGISSGRPALDPGLSDNNISGHQEIFGAILPNSPQEDAHEHVVAIFHNELALMLLEGVISERSGDDSDNDTELGSVYRMKLRKFLSWPGSKLRPERFLESLPSSFLPEKALVLGRLDKHEDAVRILYRDLKSLDLVLEYCDGHYERQQQALLSKQTQSNYNAIVTGVFSDKKFKDMPHNDDGSAYLPLVRVSLESNDTPKGCAAAIQVLALRRST
jgi:hypothetical protein